MYSPPLPVGTTGVVTLLVMVMVRGLLVTQLVAVRNFTIARIGCAAVAALLKVPAGEALTEQIYGQVVRCCRKMVGSGAMRPLEAEGLIPSLHWALAARKALRCR
jgi:hypothetical protein